MKPILSKRDLYGDEFYVWCLHQYEEARVYLKNCGRPKDDFDRFKIDEMKWQSAYFKRLID